MSELRRSITQDPYAPATRQELYELRGHLIQLAKNVERIDANTEDLVVAFRSARFTLRAINWLAGFALAIAGILKICAGWR